MSSTADLVFPALHRRRATKPSPELPIETRSWSGTFCWRRPFWVTCWLTVARIFVAASYGGGAILETSTWKKTLSKYSASPRTLAVVCADFSAVLFCFRTEAGPQALPLQAASSFCSDHDVKTVSRPSSETKALGGIVPVFFFGGGGGNRPPPSIVKFTRERSNGTRIGRAALTRPK